MRAPLAVTLAVAAVGVACATPGHAQSRERDAHVLTDKLFVTQIVPSLVGP
jgi:hypothetical protein